MEHTASSLSIGRIGAVALAGYLGIAALWWLRTGVLAPSAGEQVAPVPVGGGNRVLRAAFGPVGEACCQTLMSVGMCVALLMPM